MGNLGKQVVAVFDARLDIPWSVLKFALALEIERIEKHLCDRLGVFLSGQAFRKLCWDSLVRQQFLQVNSNNQTSFCRESERSSRNRDTRGVVFRSRLLFGPIGSACCAKKLGQTSHGFWASCRPLC